MTSRTFARIAALAGIAMATVAVAPATAVLADPNCAAEFGGTAVCNTEAPGNLVGSRDVRYPLADTCVAYDLYCFDQGEVIVSTPAIPAVGQTACVSPNSILALVLPPENYDFGTFCRSV